MCLQLADQSVRYPAGIAENIPVKIRNFFKPVDFVVLDMEVDTKTPLILGRPFLSMAIAHIDVGAGVIKLYINRQKEKFSVKPKVKQCSQVKAFNRKKKSVKETEKPSIPSMEVLIEFIESLQIQEEANVRSFWNRKRKRSKQRPQLRKCGGRKCHHQGLHPATTTEPKVWRVPLQMQNPSPCHEVHGTYPSLHCI